jgi:hypothetical protein
LNLVKNKKYFMGEIKNEVIAYGLKIIDNGAISYVDG